MRNYNGITELKDSYLGGNAYEGDPYSFAPSVWQYLIDRFQIETVMDLGSGRGYSANFFFKKGLKVIAVDGMRENCFDNLYPTVQVDLTKDKVVSSVDLVFCQELVEHIEEKYLDNLLESLACGKFIVMTNALPGQGGHHHVNEQPTQYWIDHLSRKGYRVLEEDTTRVRKLARDEGAVYLSLIHI